MMDERSRRFDEAYDAWRDRLSEGKPAASLLRMLLREYREVWESGDEHGRIAVLMFIRHNAPPGSEDIVWASLRSSSRPVAALGLGVAMSCVLVHHIQPDAEAVSTLVRIVRDDPNQTQRFMALHVLTLAEVEGLDSWLQVLADRDVSPTIRREANIALMCKGHAEAKAALFAELREHPEYFGVASRLWERRQTVDFTDDEERELRGMLLRYVESVRARLHDPDGKKGNREMAVGMLRPMVQQGFPFEEEDVEAVGDVANTASETEDRLDAVDTLAAFGTPRARRLLEDIASGDQPKRVADRARRALRRRSR